MDEQTVKYLGLSDKRAGETYHLRSSYIHEELKIPRVIEGDLVKLVGFKRSISGRDIIHVVEHPLYSHPLHVFEYNLSTTKEPDQYELLYGQRMVLAHRCEHCSNQKMPIRTYGTVRRIIYRDLSLRNSIIFLSDLGNLFPGCSLCMEPVMFADDDFNFMEW